MGDSIFVRVQKVVTGGLDSAVGAAEQLSGTSLMRQAIRDMEDAIAKARTQAEAARETRLQAEHRIAGGREQLATLKEQARFALSKGREDLAEAAIARQIEIEAQVARLGKAQQEAAEEERRLEESRTALNLRKGQMEEELAAFQSARRAAAFDDAAPGRPEARVERRAEQAETAFRRAVAAAGGVAGEAPTADTAARVAEIEALQKEAAVAERLAALRAGQTAKPAAPRKRAQG
ncbi:MAG TPA: PspA/IM30 family protein [Allosphingosinicella sp.]|jgi:phage shock protein A